MSDDLTDRLREVTGGKLDYTNTPNSLRLASADRIDELEAKLDDKEAECRHLRGQVGLLKAKLEKAMQIIKAYGEDEGYVPRRVVSLYEELSGPMKGQNDE